MGFLAGGLRDSFAAASCRAKIHGGAGHRGGDPRVADTAAHVQTGGGDGVEIHGSHGYLVSNFLSPWWNPRRSLGRRYRKTHTVGTGERRLRERDFLAGKYSVADIACYPWAVGIAGVGLEINEWPTLSAWIDRIRVRPAVGRAAASLFGEGEQRAKYVQARPQLSTEEWSNLFGDRMLAPARFD